MPEPEVVLLSDDSGDDAPVHTRSRAAESSGQARQGSRAGSAGIRAEASTSTRGNGASTSGRAGPSRAAGRQTDRRRRRGVEVNLLLDAGDSPRLQLQNPAFSGSPDGVVDLTKIPDDEILILGSLSTSPRSGKRRKTAAALKAATPVPPAPPMSPTAGSAKCPICMDVMDEMACGPCGHVFCNQCLRNAVKAQKKCPTCRRAIQPRSIHRIFLNTD